MSDPIVDAAQKHPAPEGLVYTYGTAGVGTNRVQFIEVIKLIEYL